jgi:YVTN family beta-propeller protein
MAGAVVTDLDLCEAPNDNNICGPTTDLAGVYVDDPDTDCDIFETCEPGNPICSALPAGSCPFDVVDEAICQLDVPEEVALFTCPAGSNLGAGALVTDSDLCNAATPAEQCPAGTQLENVWVTDATAANCSVNGLTLLQCPAGTNLAGAVVTDPDLCDAAAPAEACPGGTDLAGVWVVDATTDCDIFETCPVGTTLEGTIVTDLDLCDLVTEENKECQICATLVNSLLAPSAVNIVFDAINTYDPPPPDGETGLEEICKSEDPITAYNTFVDQIPNPPADPGLQLFLKQQFATCEGVAEPCGDVTVGPTITGLNAPRDIAYDPDFDRMYVVTRDGGGSVSVISTATNAQIAGSPILGVGTSPFGIAHDPVNQEMYVTDCENTGCNTVTRIDTTTNPPAEIGTVTVGTSPLNLAYDPEHERMYVTNLGGTTVSVIDTTQNPPVEDDTITVGNQPWGIAYDPFHKTMYVTNFGSSTVSVISTDTNTVIATIPQGGNFNGPTDITYDPVHERMYVTNFSGNTVSVIDTETNTVINTITHSSFANPVYVTFDPINQDMYVTNQGGTIVTVIDTVTNTISTINLAPNASGLIGIAYDPENQRMYVGGRDSGTVSVINLCPAII